MVWNPRNFHYHVWDDPAFDTLAPLAAATLTIPAFDQSGTETRTMYSLKRDMDELRTRGHAKGIADAGVVSVGNSAGGRALCALKVGNGAAHKVLFTGAHHAREWISAEIPYLVAEYLIESYTDTPATPKEKRIKHLLQNRQIWFVPIANPDGHHYTTTMDRNWRPNRRTHNVHGATIHRSPANGGSVTYLTGPYTGVDINRNYNTPDWGTETFHNGDVTTSCNPADGGADSIWCGLAGSGEAESLAIDTLIRAHAFRASITYHNFGQLLLYPDTSNVDHYVQWVGGGIRDLVNAGGNPYSYEASSTLYRTTGDLLEFSPSYSPDKSIPD
ncbi:MAG TPA: M14 family zinc carboxypeptidase [Acetobacteraceae bacterium]|nr:M14 family zinc carboxypeptidase [Acetobacteraceae bacterium]